MLVKRKIKQADGTIKDSDEWYVSFRANGRQIRRASGTSNRKKAEAFETKLRADAWNAAALGIHVVSWADARTEFVAVRHRPDADRRDTRDLDVLKMAGLVFGEMNVADITKADIARYGALIADRTSLSNANTHLRYLRTFLRWCHARDYRPEVPTIEFFRPKKFEPVVLTPERFAALLAALPEWVRPVAVFAAETGLRWSNYVLLRWEPAAAGSRFVPYVDKDGLFVHIPPSSAKAGEAIHLPLNTRAWDIIKALPRHGHGYIFSDPEGNAPIEKIRKPWYRACDAVGLPGLRWHDLRHYWCTQKLQNGVPERVVQELGGWQTRSMVQRYSHLAIDHLRKYVDK